MYSNFSFYVRIKCAPYRCIIIKQLCCMHLLHSAVGLWLCRIWFSRHDEKCISVPWRQDYWSRDCSRLSLKTLSFASTGQRNFNQSIRLHVLLME